MSKICDCVFPVAGLGTRFLPASKATPKELFPVGNLPLIHYAVEEANHSDILNMHLVINKHKLALKEYFDLNHNIHEIFKNRNKTNIGLEKLERLIQKCNFSYSYQNVPLGLGSAILEAEKHIAGDYFSVILPDDLCINNDAPVLKQMINLSEKYPKKCILAIEEIDIDDSNKYGIVDIKNEIENNVYEVADLIEKPEADKSPSNFAIIGRYILTSNIFEFIKATDTDSNGEIQLTDALKGLAKQGSVLAYKFSGKRYDCGTKKGWIEANNLT